MTEVNQIEQLTTNPGPRKRVSIIKAAIIKERTMLYGGRQINTSALAAELSKQLFTNSHREMLVVAVLDAKCNPLSSEIAAIGNVNSCIVSPRKYLSMLFCRMLYALWSFIIILAKIIPPHPRMSPLPNN